MLHKTQQSSEGLRLPINLFHLWNISSTKGSNDPGLGVDFTETHSISIKLTSPRSLGHTMLTVQHTGGGRYLGLLGDNLLECEEERAGSDDEEECEVKHSLLSCHHHTAIATESVLSWKLFPFSGGLLWNHYRRHAGTSAYFRAMLLRYWSHLCCSVITAGCQ